MNRYGPEFEGASRLLINYSLVGSIVVVIATPAFVINNIASGRNALGVVAFLVVLVSAVNAWSCVKGRYCLYLVLLGLVPAIMIFLVFTFRNLGVIGALWSYPVVLIFYMMLSVGSYAMQNFFYFFLV